MSEINLHDELSFFFFFIYIIVYSLWKLQWRAFKVLDCKLMFLFKFLRWLRRRSITQSSWCLSFPTGTFYNWFCKFKNNRRTFERIGAWGRQQCPNLSAWEQTRIWTINQCNGRKHLHKLLNFVHRVCRLLVAVLTQQRAWIKKIVE